MSGAAETIAAAQSAWARIERASTFDDWVAIGRGLAIGRAHAMKVAGSNSPMGGRYVTAMNFWLTEHKLDGVNKSERCLALKIIQHLPAITSWRETLNEVQRRRLNHPNAIWAHYRRATGCGGLRVVPHREIDVTLVPKSHRGRMSWSAETLQRAADAVFDLLQRGSNDALIIAKAALDAAGRAPGTGGRPGARAPVYMQAAP